MISVILLFLNFFFSPIEIDKDIDKHTNKPTYTIRQYNFVLTADYEMNLYSYQITPETSFSYAPKYQTLAFLAKNNATIVLRINPFSLKIVNI